MCIFVLARTHTTKLQSESPRTEGRRLYIWPPWLRSYHLTSWWGLLWNWFEYFPDFFFCGCIITLDRKLLKRVASFSTIYLQISIKYCIRRLFKTSESCQELKIMLCWFAQYSATQHALIMMDPPDGQLSWRGDSGSMTCQQRVLIGVEVRSMIRVVFETREQNIKSWSNKS